MKRQWIVMCVSACLVCCLFVFNSGNVFAANYPAESLVYKNQIVYLYPSNASSTSNADLYAAFTFSEFLYTEASDTGTATYRTLCKIILRNTTSYDLIIPSSYIQFTPTFTSSWSAFNIYDVEYVDGDLIIDRVGTSGKFYLANHPDNALNSNIIVPSNGDRTLICYFVLSAPFTNVSITWNYPALPFTPVQVAAGDALVSSYPEYLKWIYFRLNTIYDALLSQAQSGQGTVDTGEDTQTEIETIHGEEQTWFTQTETDIEGTGLSTFSFTGDASTGITGVKDQFVQVWNAMGILNIIPIFALSLKLAATIIRHVPARRNPATSEPAPGREIGFIHDLHNPSQGVIWRQ